MIRNNTIFDSLADLPIWVIVILGIWMCSQISLPIVEKIGGPRKRIVFFSLSVWLQVICSFLLLRNEWGIGLSLAGIAIIVAIGWGAEYIGVQTGFPFGKYSYTKILRPQIGKIPIIVPGAWAMMLPAAWSVSWVSNPFATIAIGAGAMTAWDLFIDPLMVRWNYWRWHRKGRYFGVPLTNFFGWFFTSSVAIGTVMVAINPPTPPPSLVFIYIISWALQSIGQMIFWKMRGSGITGCCAMGLFIIATFI